MNPTEAADAGETSLGLVLLRDLDAVVQRWYERWRDEGAAHGDVSEAALKDLAPLQLRVIAEALQDGTYRRESPRALWREQENTRRLEPETRVFQNIPIEEVVQEYWLLVSTVRDWLQEREITPAFAQYTYFYEAVFELVAESVRRYSAFQADEVKRERAEYLAGVAHQMRGPISILAVGLERLKPRLCAEDEHLLAGLQRGVDRLTAQATAVMRLERYKEGEIPVRPEAIRPAQLIDRIVLGVEAQAAKKNLAIAVHASPAVAIRADPELTEDALDNLITNAVKYTEHGCVRIEVEEGERRVRFRVADTGPGIDPRRQADLFRPVHPSVRGGFGLGLAVAYRAVKAQGGSIGVESEIGKGSLFWFTLAKEVEPRE